MLYVIFLAHSRIFRNGQRKKKVENVCKTLQKASENNVWANGIRLGLRCFNLCSLKYPSLSSEGQMITVRTMIIA